MPMSTSFIPSEDRLDLSFHGDLDLTMSEEVCRVFASIPVSLRTCIMDLTGLDRVFDSGLALLWMLNERLSTSAPSGRRPERSSRTSSAGSRAS
jgi:ABC-type transporter Mla MlaB component